MTFILAGGRAIVPRVPFVHISDFELLIKDVFRGGIWQWDNLITIMPSAIQEEARSLGLITFHHSAMDVLYWAGSSSGEYTVKSGYEWIIARRNISMDKFKVWVWKIKAPQKIRVLLWFTVHDSLPTNKLRFKRWLGPSLLYPMCGLEPESILHLFFVCLTATAGWNDIGGLPGNAHYFMSLSVDEVLFNLCRKWTSVHWGLMWSVWCARNEVCFQGEATQVHSFVHWAHLLGQGFDRAFAK